MTTLTDHIDALAEQIMRERADSKTAHRATLTTAELLGALRLADVLDLRPDADVWEVDVTTYRPDFIHADGAWRVADRLPSA